MTISKRTRFEVLRRDEHTCQYCGARAPEVTLHIDHVEPVALGGSDRPDNLLTACSACNSGKGSIAPDAPLVSGLSDRAAAYALGMVDTMTRFRATVEEGDTYVETFEDVWNRFSVAGDTVPMPIDYEATLHRWYRMGVPERVIDLAVKAAMAKEMPRTMRSDFPRWAYFCGVVWRQIEQLQVDHSLNTADPAVATESEVDEVRVDSYWAGRKAGSEIGYEEGFADGQLFRDANQDLLACVIDGRATETSERMRYAA